MVGASPDRNELSRVPERGPSVERKKAVPPPLRPEIIAASKFSEAEKRRRERATRDVQAAAKSCDRLENILYHRAIDKGGENGKRALEEIALRQQLMDGAIVSKGPIGEPGVNVTEVGTILDERTGETVKAVIKPASGEKTFSYDPDEQKVMVVSKRAAPLRELERSFSAFINEEDLERERASLVAQGYEAAAVEESIREQRSSLRHQQQFAEKYLKEFPGSAAALAREYGVDVKTIVGLYLDDAGLSAEEIEEMWLAGEESFWKEVQMRLELTYRQNQPAGWGHTREFVFSQMDKLLDFGVIPETVLRAEKDKTGKPQEIMSVQKLERARGLSEDELEGLWALETSHPLAKQMTRIAALDYLLVSSDRHGDNFLLVGEDLEEPMYDPSTHTWTEKDVKLAGIDNAYAMGLGFPESSRRWKEEGSLEKGLMLRPFPHVSVPLEYVRLKNAELDEEALAGVRDVYEKILLYSQERPKFKKLQEKYRTNPASMTAEETALYQKMDTVGEYPKYVTDLFRLAFRSDGSDPDREKIVQIELDAFLERCEYLLKHKRPPLMEDVSPVDASGLMPKHTKEWKRRMTQAAESPFDVDVDLEAAEE
ncbi:hypothetical protein EDM68_04170 [Candidatus Uhrbacteria bacterium]|nr:MAG: hypothetical protein EDM68_04170 [Candidatus Uhrbacteria bacterium]